MSTYFADVVERAVKTAAQAAIAAWIVTDNLAQDWGNVVVVSGAAAILSVLSSVASRGFGRNTDSASLVR